MLKLKFLSAPAVVALAFACTPPAGNDAGPAPDDIGCDLADDCGADDGRPELRSEVDAVYDQVNQRMIVFGGTNTIPVDCDFPDYQYLSETWAFYDRCGTWRRIATEGAPPARGRHMMAYDKTNNQMLVFGGRCCRSAVGGNVNYSLYGDLWSLDLLSDTWSQINTNPGPAARDNGSFVVDPSGNKAYLFGGNLSTSGLSYNVQNDLWELDLGTNTWTQLTPGGTAPSIRLWSAALLDSERGRIVIYGGDDNDAFFGSDSLGDLWAYDIEDNAWLQLHDGAGIAPTGRFWSRIDYDSQKDRYLMFGGHDDTPIGNTNEIWAFDPQDFVWIQLGIGDTYNLPGANCQFPPDFTNVDMSAPERRNAHAMTYSNREGCPGLLTTMGKTDCGASDDVWRWRVDNDEWEEMNAARRGEMCLRADRGFDCQEMCE